MHGILAQLGEHLPYKQGVIGSSPIGPIKPGFYSCIGAWFYGEIAQLARARGSYPRCRGFKSPSRYYLDSCTLKDVQLFFCCATANKNPIQCLLRQMNRLTHRHKHWTGYFYLLSLLLYLSLLFCCTCQMFCFYLLFSNINIQIQNIQRLFACCERQFYQILRAFLIC